MEPLRAAQGKRAPPKGNSCERRPSLSRISARSRLHTPCCGAARWPPRLPLPPSCLAGAVGRARGTSCPRLFSPASSAFVFPRRLEEALRLPPPPAKRVPATFAAAAAVACAPAVMPCPAGTAEETTRAAPPGSG